MNISSRHHQIGNITRRRTLQYAALGVASFLVPGLVRARSWQDVTAIRDYIGNGNVKPADAELDLTLPLVADDGSSVPLSIQASENSGTPAIQRLALFAPKNPTPEIASFEFGPDAGTLNITTRIRLSESQAVIAIAHTQDGRVLVTERDVRVTNSGCIAPAKHDGSTEMNARVRLPDNWNPNTPGEVLTMISHPMITGLQADASGTMPPQRIIESFSVTLNEQPVITASYHRSLSINPYLRFSMMPRQDGTLRFEWIENTGRTVEHTEVVNLA